MTNQETVYVPFGGYIDTSGVIRKQYQIDQQPFHIYNKREIIDIPHIMASRIFPLFAFYRTPIWAKDPMNILDTFGLGYRHVTIPIVAIEEGEFLYRSIFVEHCIPSESTLPYTWQDYPTHTYLIRGDFAVTNLDDIATLSTFLSEDFNESLLHYYTRGKVGDYIVIASRDNSGRPGAYLDFIMIYRVVGLKHQEEIDPILYEYIKGEDIYSNCFHIECDLVGVFARPMMFNRDNKISPIGVTMSLSGKAEDHIREHLVPYLRSTLDDIDTCTTRYDIHGTGMEIWPVKYSAEIDRWTKATYDVIKNIAEVKEDESIKVIVSDQEESMDPIRSFVLREVKEEFHRTKDDDNIYSLLCHYQYILNKPWMLKHVLDTKVTVSVEAKYDGDDLLVTFGFPSIALKAIIKRTFKFDLSLMEETYAEEFYKDIYLKKTNAIPLLYDLYTIKLKPGECVSHYVTVLMT